MEVFMNINWNVLVTGPDGAVIPTYGNYGGPGYSNGEVLASPDQPVDYSAPPVDALDAAFRVHDMAYDSPDPLVRAQGDLALVQQIETLSAQPQDAEASLYGGGAIIFGLEQAALANGHPELISPEQATAALGIAANDIQYGVEHLAPQDWVGVASWLNTAEGSGALSHLEQAGLAVGEAFPQAGPSLTDVTHDVAVQLQAVQAGGALYAGVAAALASPAAEPPAAALPSGDPVQQHVSVDAAGVLAGHACTHDAGLDPLLAVVQASISHDHGWLL
jgi:hypothetical protein